MPNLNDHDLIFFKSLEFEGFQEFLEQSYKFHVISYEFPPYISFTSRKAILHTDKGIFFLKEKPKYSTDQLSLKRSALFQEYASSKLKIVPKIRLTMENDYYIKWKDKLYFLTDYKDGRVFNGSDEDVSSMLAALKKLQKTGKEFMQDFELVQDILQAVESYDVARLVPLVKASIRSNTESKIYNRIIACFENLKIKYLAVPKNEYIMSHSDFILFNLLLHENGVIAINDFDNAKTLPILHDLAEFLVSASMLNYIGSVTNMKLPVFLEPQESKFRLIIKSYIRDFHLTNDDFVLLGIIAEIVWLWTLCLSVLKGDYKILDLEIAVKNIEKAKLSQSIADTSTELRLHF